jgi:hypothetical protein
VSRERCADSSGTVPKDLARFCVGLATEEGDTVFDPFGGSLTTMAVAMEMGRRAISTELHLEYAQGGTARFDSLFRRLTTERGRSTAPARRCAVRFAPARAAAAEQSRVRGSVCFFT